MSHLALTITNGSLILGAYLLGSVPFALLLGKALGFDIRQTGSGNIGATNLARTAGRKWGILAFLLDYAKGLVPVLGAVALGDGTEATESTAALWGWLPAATGAAAVMGHVFPVFLGFRGGKGVATAFGVMTALSWPATLGAAILWGLLYAVWRTVSVASMAAAVALPAGVALFGPSSAEMGQTAVLTFSVLLALLILVRHRSNVVRLLKGQELTFR